jgi:predicted NAD-dependent protein-ADP-ribosyltransferase YbiA (DUF1768 family)
MPNASFGSKNPVERQLSNLSYSEFIFRGRLCHSFEGFYQGIKRSGDDIQNHIFLMFGMYSKKQSKPTKHVYFNGQVLKAGSDAHHDLLFEVQICKYTQHEDSKQALLSTGSSSITHNVGRDSEVYPAKVYCKHLTKIRSMLQNGSLK